jgi:hypothetical protein
LSEINDVNKNGKGRNHIKGSPKNGRAKEEVSYDRYFDDKIQYPKTALDSAIIHSQKNYL